MNDTPGHSQTTTRNNSLTRRDFFHDVVEAVRPLLPESLRGFHSYTTRNLLKLSYGQSRIHYEVWANARDRHIEIGLHFEDGPDSTEALIRYLDANILEIKHELGAGFELERWTNSWGHLFQLMPYQPLTDDLTRQISITLAHLISLLQPMLHELPGTLPSRARR